MKKQSRIENLISKFLQLHDRKIDLSLDRINRLNRDLKIYYNSFQKLNSFDLPRLVGIIINDGKNLIKLTISNQSREINNELSFPFKIPNNYKKIKL